MVVKDDVSTNWKLFRQSWQYYVTATELNKKSKEVQAGALCSVMGMECVKVMNSLTTLTVDDKKDPEKILSALGDHFMPQKHLLFERVKFGFANQAEHETIDQYVVRLRQLAESCEFEGLCESLIRDRLVIGTRDSSTRDRLLRECPVPGLTRCIEALRASELSRIHKDQLKDAVPDSRNIVQVADKKPKRNRLGHGKKSKQGHQDKMSPRVPSKFCGTNHPYDRSKCPASGKTCLKCGKQGHFAVKCQEKKRAPSASANKVHQASATQEYADQGSSTSECGSETESDDSIFATERVGVVNSNASCSSFMVPLMFHTEYAPTITTQLDTGATCSAMSYNDLLTILQNGDVKLGPPGGKIRLYDGRVVEPLGSYTFTVSLNSGPKCKIHFDILERAPWPIIDGNTCIKQGWISLGSGQYIHSSNSKEYEPLSFDKLMRDYDDIFTGLGCLPGEYHIEVDPDIKPVQHAPRRVPVPRKARLKEKIAEMEKQGIIVRETEPTDWISSLVAVQKPGKLRVCINPRDLNRAIKRPKYPMPTVEEVLPKLAKAKVFTVLDAKDGFHQVKLDKESSLLTTFWTPFGRYRYLRMPQGISSAPEEYQRRQNEALSGLNGVEVIADDILCCGSGETIKDALADHDSNLLSLLDRAREVNLKLNKKKLRLRLDQVPYMGHLFTSEGLRPDPQKVEATVNMPRPDDKRAVQRLLGCVTYLSRFMPTLSEVSEPLRKLREKNNLFMWESQQEEAFQTIKNMISSTPVLKYYDVVSETTIQCDASDSGLGTTLLQDGQPVAFASRSLSAVERRYAQIEKECLAIVFACTRFNQYLQGRDLTTVETDHKPLVPIFQKSLHSAPKRLQRMLLRLQKFNLHVRYLPGSQMYIADMLSRAYLRVDHSKDENIPEYQIFQLSQEQQLFQEIADINQVDYMRLSEGTHQQIKQCTVADAALQSLMNTIMKGWPQTKEEVPVCNHEYWNYKEELTVQDGKSCKSSFKPPWS